MNAVKEAWLEAARDLGIRIQDPNPLEDVVDDGARIVYLPDFGSKRGAVVFAQDFESHEPRTFDIRPLEGAGYFFSILSMQSYSRYGREHFIETLVDWGYFGPVERCPDWYTAEANRQTRRKPGAIANSFPPHY